MLGYGELLQSVTGQSERQQIFELAVMAMDELILMTQINAPLWVHSLDGSINEMLYEDEYLRLFPVGLGPRPLDLKSEASRMTTVVKINNRNIIGILMDVKNWSTIFSGIVPKAVTLEVLSPGVDGNYNGAIQVMSAEFQVPSPLVPTRKCLFVRYCKKHKDGIWGVVDVSLDGIYPGPVERSRRRPSGCLIQDMPNNCSKVTWVEHVEAHFGSVHSLYRPLVYAGLAFGAKRWVSTLKHQCERVATVMGGNITNAGTGMITTQEAKTRLLKLADRMVGSFFGSLTASPTDQWTTLSHFGTEDIRVISRKSSDDPLDPLGTILNASTSIWLPVPPKRVFDYLRDESTRTEWDMLLDGVAQEIVNIPTSVDHGNGNCISLIRANSTNANPSSVLILQESSSNPTGSYIIFAPINVVALDAILNGGDLPDNLPLLPAGFSIVPDGPESRSLLLDPPATPNVVHQRVGEGGVTTGSLLTVAFQIQVMTEPTANLSLLSAASFNNFFAHNVKKIKEAVLRANGALLNSE